LEKKSKFFEKKIKFWLEKNQKTQIFSKKWTQKNPKTQVLPTLTLATLCSKFLFLIKQCLFI